MHDVTPVVGGIWRPAVELLRDAARLARSIRAGMAMRGLVKADLSPVTVADYAVQALAGRRLVEAWPGVPLVAEESSETLRGTEGGKAVLELVTQFVSQYASGATTDHICDWIDRGGSDNAPEFWTLDPVDGTKGYLRGGQYAVALALVKDGVPVWGGLACPGLAEDGAPDAMSGGLLAVAARGQGAWSIPLGWDPADASAWRPLAVSRCTDPARARLLRSVERSHTNEAQIEEIARRLGVSAEPVLMDSQAKYVSLAAGAGEILLRLLSPDRPDYVEKIWDHAAGWVVLSEAGGTITDMNGLALDFSQGRLMRANRGLLATNGPLHDGVLQVVRQVTGFRT